jgi:NADP-dependent 3-hydroxy acid dehydrogenase YdfG
MVNVKSIFLSVQAVVPQMQQNNGGCIINISSIGSVRPRPGLVWYNSSKGAVTNVRSMFQIDDPSYLTLI